MNKTILTILLIVLSVSASTAQTADATAPIDVKAKKGCNGHCCLMAGAKDFKAPSKKFQFGIDWASLSGKLHDLSTDVNVKAKSTATIDSRMGLYISGGYQFNPYIYLGLGTGVEHQNSNYILNQPTLIEDQYSYTYHTTQWMIPVYAQFRAYLTQGYIAPYIELKSGVAEVFDLGGTSYILHTNLSGFDLTKSTIPIQNKINLYEGIAVGCRLFTCHKMTFGLQAGYNLRYQPASSTSTYLDGVKTFSDPSYFFVPTSHFDHRFTFGAGFTF